MSPIDLADESSETLTNVDQVAAHLLAGVDQYRDAQRIGSGGYTKNLARVAVLAHDKIGGPESHDRSACAIDDARVHSPLIGLREQRNGGEENRGEERECQAAVPDRWVKWHDGSSTG
jgi:hypothetical protein